MSNPRDATRRLAEERLGNIELADISLSAVMLKCARLGRLIGDNEKRQIFVYEAGGYPSTPDGVQVEIFELGRVARRVYPEKDKEGNTVEKMSTKSVEALEKQIEANQLALSAAMDPDVSLSSSNPGQMVFAPQGNKVERQNIKIAIDSASSILESNSIVLNHRIPSEVIL